MHHAHGLPSAARLRLLRYRQSRAAWDRPIGACKTAPMPDPWLPPQFEHPGRVELAMGEHLRPIRGDDVGIDYPAVMGSRERLWTTYGEAWGWPPATMTLEQDRDDLERHEREILAHESFNYAVLDEQESRLLGCVYLDPPTGSDAGDVVVSWWVVDDQMGTPLERVLDELVPRWVTEAWPFTRPVFSP
jgi:hypothetical protein